MRMPQIPCTMILCTALACESAAAALPARDGSSITAADGRTPTGDVRSMKAEREQDHQPAPGGAQKGVDPTARNPGAAAVPRRESAESRHGISRVTSPNADRLRSLLNARARGRITQQPS